MHEECRNCTFVPKCKPEAAFVRLAGADIVFVPAGAGGDCHAYHKRRCAGQGRDK